MSIIHPTTPGKAWRQRPTGPTLAQREANTETKEQTNEQADR